MLRSKGIMVNMSDVKTPTPRYAVVLKTHVWDGFVSRQAKRYRSFAGPHGDLFICVDETGGQAGTINHERVLRFTNADLIALGLADRAERGSLIWWNTDYPHYLFLDRYPDYDYYVFCEYDTVVNGHGDDLLAAVAAAGADFVALPTRTAKADWMWTRYHIRTYGYDAIAGSLNCVSIFSRRALEVLRDRRIEMSRQAEAGQVPFWPLNEVFLATEVKRAGLRMVSLDEFGDTSGFEWFPPLLESDLDAHRHLTFLHPVLDPPRYVDSLLRFSPLASFVSRRGRLGQALQRFPEFRSRLPAAFIRRAITRMRERAQGVVIRVDVALHRARTRSRSTSTVL